MWLGGRVDRPEQADRRRVGCVERVEVAGSTGLEPAASGVTGRRSNQLNYHPKEWLASRNSRSERRLVGGAGFEPATAGV